MPQLRVKTIAAQNDDDLRYCREVIYADWNRDSIFGTTSPEKVTTLGSAKSANTSILNHTFTIRVPSITAAARWSIWFP